MLNWIKEMVSPTIESPKKKLPENHTQVDNLEMALEFANKERAKYPSNKVKINEYRFKNSKIRGFKVIPFVETNLEGNPATVEIFKIKA